MQVHGLLWTMRYHGCILLAHLRLRQAVLVCSCNLEHYCTCPHLTLWPQLLHSSIVIYYGPSNQHYRNYELYNMRVKVSNCMAIGHSCYYVTGLCMQREGPQLKMCSSHFSELFSSISKAKTWSLKVSKRLLEAMYHFHLTMITLWYFYSHSVWNLWPLRWH